jgi:3-deoxy-D-manno-octulosonate 8-phosphate phosphatase (KDO 8-P phosphatase)
MIELLVFDVDGCLTDGSITYSESGDEIKSFSVKDGLAISSWVRLGKKAAIITGRRSKIVERRAKELGINYLHQGVHNKLEILENIRKEMKIEYKNISAIGDDLNDLSMLEAVGKSFTPADGSEYIKNICDTVLYNNGGHGAVREMIESIIKDDGIEEDFVKIWK